MFTAQLESVDLVSKFRVFDVENLKKKLQKSSPPSSPRFFTNLNSQNRSKLWTKILEIEMSESFLFATPYDLW